MDPSKEPLRELSEEPEKGSEEQRAAHGAPQVRSPVAAAAPAVEDLRFQTLGFGV